MALIRAEPGEYALTIKRKKRNVEAAMPLIFLTPCGALQLADFLRAPLERAGGMMPLPDVYCMYNRCVQATGMGA